MTVTHYLMPSSNYRIYMKVFDSKTFFQLKLVNQEKKLISKTVLVLNSFFILELIIKYSGILVQLKSDSQ